MFNNPGGKIKGLAKFLFWIEVIAVVIGILAMGEYLFEEVEGLIGAALILVVGVGVAYVSTLFLIAFGELVETNSAIATSNILLLEEIKKHQADGTYMKN